MSDDSYSKSVDAAKVFNRLLDFFADADSKPAAAIAHPDLDVNKVATADQSAYRQAAVLIPVTRLVSNASHVILTVRSENLKSHAGQISLPGGSTEPQDSSEEDTALRESHEEIGLHPGQVDVIGKLGELAMPSGFRVTPVVGIIESDIELTACPIEVADIFQAPLELVLDPSAYVQSKVRFQNQLRTILELHYEDYRIWGATAAILHHLAVAVSSRD